MIEAMACGTPVIAFPSGSVSEVVDDGETGFVVPCIEEAVKAVSRARMLDRAKVRGGFERRFTVERMAHGYLDVYRGLPGVARNAARVQRANGHPVALRNIATEGFVPLPPITFPGSPERGRRDKALEAELQPA